VQAFAPTNVTDSLGRSLILGGVALLLARVLDEVAGRDGQ
jgi:predicted phage tail protein